ncbi:epidermal growth factor receptor substrate 15-like 1 [Myxocyprinus asiaticus]|uniref:epidermal growth factor receptor substrate 15-like 1 n=1 Tax=Myxocyprinus asiaticus TaxID=70543 RepID=UPI00222319A0|nr:epidermal growth factor receptor substrate 15-like 1 [Myxocyprinus asiaticus]
MRSAAVYSLEKLREEMDQAKREQHSLQLNYISHSVSDLERDEMDRMLDNAKSELFSERFRYTMESMKERLDEVNQALEQREENCRALRQKCSDLEEQLVDTIREREQIKESSEEEQKQQANRFGALEQIFAQRELLLQVMEEEKKALHLELCSLREEHSLQL